MPLIDYVNLMTYTLPGTGKGLTGHHAALYSSYKDGLLDAIDKQIKTNKK